MESKVNHKFHNNIKIIEGFDMVGKTTFMKNVLPETIIYHPYHDVTDKSAGRQYSWIMGYGITDFLSQLNRSDFQFDKRLDITIDRGVFSSYVYERIYHNKYLQQEILDYYRSNKFFRQNIGHIYVKHHDSSTAEEIFNLSKSREKNPNELSNKYDTFNSFNDYWLLYSLADRLFKEVYDLVRIKPRVFETIPGNFGWVEVTGQW